MWSKAQIEKLKKTKQYKAWRTAVLDRDNWKCVKCQVMRDLIVHHIYKVKLILRDFNINTIEEALKLKQLWDLDNGITLCNKCHGKQHGLIPR